MNKSVYSLVLMDNVVGEVDKLAYEMGTSRSNLINQILAEYVNYTTPERRINDVLSTIQQLMSPSRDFVSIISMMMMPLKFRRRTCRAISPHASRFSRSLRTRCLPSARRCATNTSPPSATA